MQLQDLTHATAFTSLDFGSGLRPPGICHGHLTFQTPRGFEEEDVIVLQRRSLRCFVLRTRSLAQTRLTFAHGGFKDVCLKPFPPRYFDMQRKMRGHLVL